ncbi:hypothetical protein ABPG74_013041 [Tetrahymena malaccensis]
MSKIGYQMSLNPLDDNKRKCLLHGLAIEYYCNEVNCKGNTRDLCKDCLTQTIHETHSHLTVGETVQRLLNFQRKIENSDFNNQSNYKQKGFEKDQIKQFFNEMRNNIMETLNKIEIQFMHSIDTMEGFDHSEKYNLMQEFLNSVKTGNYITNPNPEVVQLGLQVLHYQQSPKYFIQQYYSEGKTGTESLLNGIRQHIEALDNELTKFANFKANPILKKNLTKLSKLVKDPDEPFLPTFKDKMKLFTSAQSPIYSVEMMNEDWLVAGEHEKNVLIWDLKTNNQIFTLSGHQSFVWCVCPLNNDTLASGSGDKSIRIWQFDQQRKFDSYEVKILNGHSAAVRCIIKLNDITIASAGDDHTIKIWDWASQTLIRTLSGHSGSVTSLCRPSYEEILSGSKDGYIMIWKWQQISGPRLSSQCILQIKAHDGGVQTVCQLSKTEVASGGQDKTIKIWNWATGTCIRTLSGHTGSIWKILKLSSEEIVSTANNSSIKFWNWKTESPAIRSLDRAHQGDVYSVCRLNQDTIVTVGADNRIKMWS